MWLSVVCLRVFEDSAIQMCARSVASSTGDLRYALKACRLAVEQVEANQAAAASTKPSCMVGVREMMTALSKLAGEW